MFLLKNYSVIILLLFGFKNNLSELINKINDTQNCSHGISCGINAVCVDGECECGPDFKKSESDTECVHFKCKKNQECQRNGHIRICQQEHCVCPNYFQQDPLNGGKCIPEHSNTTLGHKCIQQKDCWSDSYQRCLDGICRCHPDYSTHYNDNVCSQILCQDDDSKCLQSYDQYRVCVNDQCICQEGYMQDINNGVKCVRNPGYKGSESTWWIYVLCLVVWPIILFGILFFVWRWRKKRKRRAFNTNSHLNNQTQIAPTPISTPMTQISTNSQANSAPFTISNQQDGFFTNMFQRFSGFYDPPPSYDSIPGINNNNESIQILNVSHFNQNTETQNQRINGFANQNTISDQNSGHNYINIINPVHNNQSPDPVSYELANLQQGTTKLEQLSMQI